MNTDNSLELSRLRARIAALESEREKWTLATNASGDLLMDAGRRIAALEAEKQEFANFQLHEVVELRQRVADLEGRMTPTCSVCNWTNNGCLNLGEPGRSVWVCHGCIKRGWDNLAALESERDAAIKDNDEKERLLVEAGYRVADLEAERDTPPSEPSPCCVCGEPITPYDSYGVGKTISHRYHWTCVRKEAALVSPDYEGELAQSRQRIATLLDVLMEVNTYFGACSAPIAHRVRTILNNLTPQ